MYNVLMHYLFSFTVPFPPSDVQLDLKFIDGNVSITATWMVSGKRTHTVICYIVVLLCTLHAYVDMY